MSAEVQEALEILQELVAKLDTTVPSQDNPAKDLAQQLLGALPVIYGGGFLAEVARRWKTQINENSKGWAFFEVLPELNHNAISGYTFPQELRRLVHVVFLHSTLLHPRTLLRYELTKGFLAEHGIAHTTVEAKGGSALSQILSSVLFGDYVSYYLALLYGVDPAPVPVIDRLKEGMQDTPS